MHGIPFVSIAWLLSRHVKCTIISLKGHFENLTVITWPEKVMVISQPVSLTRTYTWFHRSSLSLSKVISNKKLLVTIHDLNWPWGHEKGSLVSIFQCRMSSLPVNRCLSVYNGVRPKEAPFSFLTFPRVEWQLPPVCPLKCRVQVLLQRCRVRQRAKRLVELDVVGKYLYPTM